ncbi:MAG: hypothetical protein KIT83_00560 [Bryobacterales bacterium]|nr:hypothetical protein [Bryobacterales bacterium]
MSSTRTYIDTKAYSASFLSDKLMYSLKEIVRESGLDPAKLTRQWTTLEKGIGRWIVSQDLLKVSVEIFHPRKNRLVGRWDMDIIYAYGGDGTMGSDLNPIRQLIEQEGSVPEECDYRVLIVAKEGAVDVGGWDDLQAYDAGDVRPKRLGHLLWAGDMAVDYSYWRKK